MSMEQLQRDIDFLAIFTNRFSNAAVCPVAREIPEDIKKQLDEYLFRKNIYAIIVKLIFMQPEIPHGI